MAQNTLTKDDKPKTSSGTVSQLYIGLLWVAITVWTTRATITGTPGGLTGVLGAAAAALPGLIAATLVASASIGSAAGPRFRGAGGRLLAGLGLGTLFGLVAAVGLRFAYGSAPSITVLAVTVGVAGVVGGALAILPGEVLEAGLWATTWVFFAGVIFGVLQPNVVKGIGGGPTADLTAQATANAQFIWAQSLLTGLLAGVYAFRRLSREQRSFTWYLIGGGLPGGVLLIAEGLTRLGGTSLAKLVHGFPAGPPVLVQLSDWSRLRHALIVLAVGAGAGLIGWARVRGSFRDHDDPDESEED